MTGYMVQECMKGKTLLGLAQVLIVMFPCTTLLIEKSYRKVLCSIVS